MSSTFGQFLKKSTQTPAANQAAVRPNRLQFNLLPDVKREYIRTEGLRSKIATTAVVASIASIAVLLILVFWTEVVQKKQLSDSAKQISSSMQAIKSESNLPKALTIQNQLYTLAALHSGKHLTSRLFEYLTQVTPANVNLGQLSLDLNTNTITLSGTADSAASVNELIDTLKLAKYTVGSATTGQPAFSSVVESNFDIGINNVSYGITANFDPNLFSNNLKDSSGALVEPQLQVSQTGGSGTIFNGSGAH
jgi:Tfp pilus assembly protein PilN